ncbi:diacylglycerol kinase family protein [uncultured Paludibaculum sp.]|uniref:diacylglycerol/lipid kinase family protein n=1 Tax=uncultured Paludibaculum sp. TaxID=1765020 RepID=UPI002AAB64B6|nr:diacylglycerol kinase family protein [uncultured Paludibaculum sp.]
MRRTIPPSTKTPISIIWNPTAGSGRALRRWSVCAKELGQHRLSIDAHMTERPGHASELAARAVQDGRYRIAAFGGDGTLHEVLQGLIVDDVLRHPEIQVVYLPAGSSCDFAKRLPTGASALQRLTAFSIHHFDLIRIECHSENGAPAKSYALSGSHVGVASLAAQRINQQTGIMGAIKRLSIDASALVAVAASHASFGGRQYQITIDDRPVEAARWVDWMVCKSPYVIGGMHLGVSISPDDGCMHAVGLRQQSLFRFLRFLPALYRGQAIRHADVCHRVCRSISVSTNPPTPVEADGEIVGMTPVRYTILPQVLPIVVPEA